MKIERINDSQMKFMLTKTDLDRRSLDVADLAYGSTKTQELFQDIIDTACKEFSFNTEDTPLMIDAVPTSKTSIMIILTKVSNPVTYQESDNGFRKLGDNSDFLPLAPKPIEGLKDVKEQDRKNKRILKNSNNRNMIFSFNSFNELNRIVSSVESKFVESSLYKYNGKYVLNVTVKKENFDRIQYIEHVLNEYGERVNGVENLVSAYIKENGELLIKKNAIDVISRI